MSLFIKQLNEAVRKSAGKSIKRPERRSVTSRSANQLQADLLVHEEPVHINREAGSWDQEEEEEERTFQNEKPFNFYWTARKTLTHCELNLK